MQQASVPPPRPQKQQQWALHPPLPPTGINPKVLLSLLLLILSVSLCVSNSLSFLVPSLWLSPLYFCIACRGGGARGQVRARQEAPRGEALFFPERLVTQLVREPVTIFKSHQFFIH